MTTRQNTRAATKTLARAAIAYARAGFAVVPLKPGTKKPYTRHGKDDATTDVEQVRRWWDENPDLNIGLRPAEDHFVIDVDSVEGHGVDGFATLAELESELGSLPENAPRAQTAKGGQHVWLSADATEFYNTLGPGVDVKSHSGYVVAPPSVIDDARYRWITKPTDELPAAPQEWVDEVRRPPAALCVVNSNGHKPSSRQGSDHPYMQAAIRDELSTLRAAALNHRNNQLFKTTVALAEWNEIDRDWLRTEVTNIATSIGLASDRNCGPSGIRKTINSAFRKADQNPARQVRVNSLRRSW